MPPPRFLVSNDDGVRAPGLQTLTRELHACGLYDVRVGAPETERSGSSHAVTSCVQATRYTDGSAVGLPSDIVCYSARGYPTDAVRLAFQSDIFGHEWVPDVVVSGMNRGLNAGRALLISGTVAAAREGTFHGAKAVAVSIHSFSSRMHDPNDYTCAARDFLPILHWFVSEQKWPSGVILNVNIPHENTTGKISRWMPAVRVASTAGAVSTCLRVVPQGQSSLQFRSTPSEACVPARKTEGETRMYKFRWHVAVDPQATPENDDLVAVLNNCLTLTPVPVGPGDDVTAAMKLLNSWTVTHRHPRLQWSPLPN